MNIPGPSPTDLQTHLYSSFLEAKTADVSLHVRGTWEAVYRLHRVVLIQSGYFSSLFTAGFAESAQKHEKSSQGPDEINITFDDRNITRAAFEVCIARLYGGGPSLHISPSLIPTSTQPLTPGFPTSAPEVDVPPDQHPATPRFLLSLLATSVYLSIPSTASQALNLILGSIGPHTVIEYLNFTLGKPIRNPSDREPDAAVGLENIAQAVNDGTPSSAIELTKWETVNPDISRSSESSADDQSDIYDGSATPLSFCADDGNTSTHEPSFHYGAISYKIGEACACWLARWGPDVLKLEENTRGNINRSSTPVNSSPRNSLAPSRYNIPAIWARNGLSAEWASALVSSDALFVRGERERYELAKSIVELRRRDGLNEAEEEVWRKMFRHGIYYSNMSTEDIIGISQEASPTTGRLFVPLSVLQAALWSQSVLRHHILSSSSSKSPPKDNELGITETTADILVRLSTLDHPDHEKEAEKRYYPIPTDCSSRLGDDGTVGATSMDQLFYSKPNNTLRVTTSESNFFGLASEHSTAASCISTDATGKSRWSPYPPFRFAVEFWDVESLREKCRLHSHTVWYAGSLFNVYVQVVRKKGIQLGVYLHRQSSIDPIPPSSAPSVMAVNTHERQQQSHMPTQAAVPTSPSSPLIRSTSRSTTPLSPTASQTPSSPTPSTTTTVHPVTVPAHAPRVTPAQPYRDPRGSILAYFSIACASANGSASLTQFTSAPDVFSVSQSWGWKSSSLKIEESLQTEDEDGHVHEVKSELVSLRATVVLGIV